MRILGIDPGVATTGWGVIDEVRTGTNGVTMVEYGVIETSKVLAQQDRLLELRSDLLGIIEEFKPDYMGIELLYFCRNVTTAIKVGEARGVVLLAAAEHKVPIREFTPLQVKDAVCGYGKAPKRQVQEMVQSILELDDIPRPDDAADGLAVAIACSSSLATESSIKSAE